MSLIRGVSEIGVFWHQCGHYLEGIWQDLRIHVHTLSKLYTNIKRENSAVNKQSIDSVKLHPHDSQMLT